MSFLKELMAVYKLHRNGSLNTLLQATDTLRDKQDKINQQLDSLAQSVNLTTGRLGQVQDAAVRKSLNLSADVDFAASHVSFETAYRVIAAGCAPFLVGPAGSGKSTILAQIAAAIIKSQYDKIR